MSYQAITDIIVNPLQLQEQQLSNSIKDSPKTNSSDSFAELVSFYKKDSEPEVNAAPKSEAEANQNTVKETSENEKTTDSKEVKDEKKTDEVTDKKVAESERDKQPEEKVENDKKSKVSDKNELKTDEKSGSEKKLNSKDFARLNQLTEKQFEEEAEKNVSLNTEVQQKNIKFDAKGKKDTEESENLAVLDTQVEIPQNEIKTSEMNNESSEFNFENKNSDKSKQLTLDKEGKITVEDLRTNPQETKSDENKTALKVTDVKLTNENTAVMTMDLNNEVNADVLSLNNQSAGADGSNFQAMLNNQIQTSAPEFVKAGNLVLKDNNQGTINLVLHPDDLGNVKIHLSLDGKSISGHITVATKEALEVFKDNAETLREAFIKNGFDTASFDVSLSNGGSFNQNESFAQNDGSDIFAKSVYGNKSSSIDAELESILQNVDDISNYSVNIVA